MSDLKTPKTKNTTTATSSDEAPAPPSAPPATPPSIRDLCTLVGKPHTAKTFLMRDDDWKKALKNGRKDFILETPLGELMGERLKLLQLEAAKDPLPQNKTELLRVLTWATITPKKSDNANNYSNTPLTELLLALRELCDESTDETSTGFKATFARYVLECVLLHDVSKGHLQDAVETLQLNLPDLRKMAKRPLQKLIVRHIVGVSEAAAERWVDSFVPLETAFVTVHLEIKTLVKSMYWMPEAAATITKAHKEHSEALSYWLLEETETSCDSASLTDLVPSSTGEFSATTLDSFMKLMQQVADSPSLTSIFSAIQALDELHPGWGLEARLLDHVSTALPSYGFSDNKVQPISPTSNIGDVPSSRGDGSDTATAERPLFRPAQLCQNPVVRPILAEWLSEPKEDDLEIKAASSIRPALEVPLVEDKTDHEKALAGQFWLPDKINLMELCGAGSFGMVVRGHSKAAPEKEAAFKYEIVAKDRLLRTLLLSLECHSIVAYHKNVVNLFGCSFHEASHKKNKNKVLVCTIMEHCVSSLEQEGKDMREKLKSGVISRDEMREWLELVMLHIMSALELCHSKKIIHRDLKPGNVLLGKDGQYKVADFGSARNVATHGMTSEAGTEGFKAPEVDRRNNYNESADIWSAAAVLLNLTTGSTPVDHAQDLESKEKLEQLLEDSERWKSLFHLYDRMIVKGASKRITATDAKKELEEAVAKHTTKFG